MTSPAQILALQRTVGNRAVQRLLAKNQPVSQPARSAAQPTVSLAPSVPGPATPIRRSTLGPRIQRFIGKDKDGGTAIRVSDGAKFSIFFDREEDDIHYYNLAGLTTSEFFDNVPEDTDEFDLPGAVVATPTTFVPKPSKYESLDDFEGPPSNENQARKQQLLITYIDNLILAGLPQKKVVRAATAALNQKGGWKHADIDTITEVFAEGLQSDIDDVSRALLKACFTETPNEEDLQRWALEREPEAVEEAFELEDEAAFVDDTAQHFLGDGEQFKKLWRTATPGQKQLIHSLMTADEEALPLSRIGYLVEAIDLPRHRSGLDPQVASWANSSSEKSFFDYLDAHPPENLRSITYYSDAEKEEHRLVHAPSLFFSGGEPLDGDNIFVMDENEEIYAGDKSRGEVNIHHSSFLSGQAVASAGHLFVNNGDLWKINLASGHYQPSEMHLARALLVFQGWGVDLSQVQAVAGEHDAEEQITGDVWLARYLKQFEEGEGTEEDEGTDEEDGADEYDGAEEDDGTEEEYATDEDEEEAL